MTTFNQFVTSFVHPFRSKMSEVLYWNTPTPVTQPGIRLRRDNWVSVRYAEELNSGQSSVIP